VLWLPAQAEFHNVALDMKYSISVALPFEKVGHPCSIVYEVLMFWQRTLAFGKIVYVILPTLP